MHKSVLLGEVLDGLHIQNSKRYIDATLGAGGHSLEILKLGGRVLGIEADPKMLKIAEERLGAYSKNAKLVLGNFRDIKTIALKSGFNQVDGILFDLGISSFHLDSDDRGFSFKNPGASLDMRLNRELQGVTARDLLNSLDQKQLTNLLESAGLAKKVVEFRLTKPFELVGDLLSLFGGKKRIGNHPATKAFMALRIAVNSELENLESTLPLAFDLLKMSGRLAVVSFHSGEDRIVKRFYKKLEKEGQAKLNELTLPSDEELENNHRARSAKLRVLTKI